MDPSSPAKRRALAPLDANVNAISSPTKLHKHSKLGAAPQSPRKSSSPVKSLNLKRSFAAATVDIFDENALVPKKKQCQEPASALAASSDAATTTTNTIAAPVAVAAPAREVALAPEATSPITAIPSTSVAAPTPAPAPAQTEMEMDVDPDATETQSEQSEEQNQHSEQPQQPELEVVQGEHELPEQQREESQHETPRTRSASPADTSAVFDTSAMDTSQNTTILTEPDAEQQARTVPPPRPRRLLTREEARQKARILRLKLGLANYKLQTGQENVPLDKLEVKPRPGQQQQETKVQAQTQTTETALPRVMVQPPSSRDGPPEKERTEEEVVEETETDEPEQSQESAEAEAATTQAQAQVQVEKEPRSVAGVLPRLDMDNLKAGNDEDEPTSAVSGGIVSSLLSLARGSSSSVSTSS
ncbi:hypothetical protein CaCOL14_006664 [Colletotrichum acutatum]|uniref:Cyclin-dependent kinase protein n=1 Tax=Glomerella acutata TaxID=27357 RepID=A0AAD8XLW9_GLOAC|nr:uncharacterized protein BDZ83DRAFT_15156 [Colletotrichum acutatum]KAK1729704.1 hypothetical protein BDZ83DRAFT_15156 [Colletotrichum acutatum]